MSEAGDRAATGHDGAVRLDARALVGELDARGIPALRSGLAALIDDGVLAPGSPLPTVREIAAELGIGVGTVAAVWAELRREGYLVTRRRGGSIVRGADAAGIRDLELRSAPADPALLPDLGAALAAVLAEHPVLPGVRSAEPLPALRRAAERHRPFAAESVAVVPSVRAALHLVVSALLPARPVIATVDPLCARTAAALAAMPAQLLPVDVDSEGPVPESLAAALAAGAELFAYQPAWSVPTGASLSAERAEALAVVVEAHPGARVFEENPAGPLRPDSPGLGALLPGRVLHAANTRRAFGAEPAAALLYGSAADLAAIGAVQRREGTLVGALSQLLLAQLLSDREVGAGLRRASAAYAVRHGALREGLNANGVDVAGDGYFLWVPVGDARRTARALAADGIRIAIGSHSSLGSRGRGRVRIGTTLAPAAGDESAALAGAVALAAS